MDSIIQESFGFQQVGSRFVFLASSNPIFCMDGSWSNFNHQTRGRIRIRFWTELRCGTVLRNRLYLDKKNPGAVSGFPQVGSRFVFLASSNPIFCMNGSGSNVNHQTRGRIRIRSIPIRIRNSGLFADNLPPPPTLNQFLNRGCVKETTERDATKKHWKLYI